MKDRGASRQSDTHQKVTGFDHERVAEKLRHVKPLFETECITTAATIRIMAPRSRCGTRICSRSVIAIP